MSNTIKIKRSGTSGNVPLVSELDQGELGMNVPDGLLFLKRVNGSEQVVKFQPYTGDFAAVAVAVGYYSLSPGTVAVEKNYNITTGTANAELTFYNLSSLRNGLRGRIIINRADSRHVVRVPDNTGVKIEKNSWIYDQYNNSTLVVSELTSGPPTNCTLRSTSNHNLSIGDKVEVTGFDGDKAAYNGVHEVNEIVDALTFRIDVGYQASGSSSSPEAWRVEPVFDLDDLTEIDYIKDADYLYMKIIAKY